jgi:predicted DNA-binding ArsR family transcriptional regulator
MIRITGYHVIDHNYYIAITPALDSISKFKIAQALFSSWLEMPSTEDVKIG